MTADECIIERQVPQSTFKVDRNQECAVEQFFANVRGILSEIRMLDLQKPTTVEPPYGTTYSKQ